MGLWDSITWSGSTCRAAERWTAEDTHVGAGTGSRLPGPGRINLPRRGVQPFQNCPDRCEGTRTPEPVGDVATTGPTGPAPNTPISQPDLGTAGFVHELRPASTSDYFQFYVKTWLFSIYANGN